MVHCVAVDCVNNIRGGNKNISFYRLPRDNSLKKIWIQKSNVKICLIKKTYAYVIYILKIRVLKEIDIHVLLNNQTLVIF